MNHAKYKTTDGRALALFVCLLTGIQTSHSAFLSALPHGITAQPLAQLTPQEPPNRFEKLPAAVTGIDFGYRWNRDPRYERLLNSSAVGGGVCAGDYDNDGLPELCLTRPAGGYCLYRNLGHSLWRSGQRRLGGLVCR